MHQIQLCSSRLWLSAEVSGLFRAILVDWLMEAAIDLDLCMHTLFLAVAYTDRFVRLQHVTREEAQGIGLTCLWIASYVLILIVL